jgi:hypothetical protein
METVIVRMSLEIECDNVRTVCETINNREFQNYNDLRNTIAEELKMENLDGVSILSLNDFIECANDDALALGDEFIAQCRVGYSSYKEEQEAKEYLKARGYFVDNLWCVDDVRGKFECSDEQAQSILEESLTNCATMGQIWDSIDTFGEMANLTRVPEENEEE